MFLVTSEGDILNINSYLLIISTFMNCILCPKLRFFRTLDILLFGKKCLRIHKFKKEAF